MPTKKNTRLDVVLDCDGQQNVALISMKHTGAKVQLNLPWLRMKRGQFWRFLMVSHRHLQLQDLPLALKGPNFE
jgi:hypothetical protein